MTRFPFLPLLALALLAALAGCPFYQPELEPLIDCQKYEFLDNCYYDFAINNPDVDYCQKIQNPEKKENCNRELAQLLNDKSLCKIYSSDADDCLLNLASANVNPNLCAEIAKEQTSFDCYKRIALKKTDEGLCLLIKNRDDKGECLTAVAVKQGKPETCFTVIDAALQQRCFDALAVKHNSTEFCEQLSRREHVDSCYAFLGTSRQDASLCNKVLDPAKRDACNRSLGLVEEEELALKERLLPLCGQLAGNDKQQCLADANGYAFTPLFCARFKGGIHHEECIGLLVHHFNDAVLCGQHTRQAAADACYRELAVKLLQPGACKPVVNFAAELRCFYDVALAARDYGVCPNIYLSEDNLLRNDCFFDVAQLAQQPEACDGINDKKRLAQCRAKLALALNDFSLCEAIPNEPIEDSTDPFFARDTCFLEATSVLRDARLCTHIRKDSRKKECLALAAIR